MALANKKSSKDNVFHIFGRRQSCSPSTRPTPTDQEEVSVLADACGIESAICPRKTLEGSLLSKKKDVSINLSASTEATACVGLTSCQSAGSATGHPASSLEEDIKPEKTATDDAVDTLVRMWEILGTDSIFYEAQGLLFSSNSQDDDSTVASDDTSVTSAELDSSSGNSGDCSLTDEYFEADDLVTCLTTPESKDGTLGEDSIEEVSAVDGEPEAVQLCAVTSPTTSSSVEDVELSADADDDPSDAESFSPGSSNSQVCLEFGTSSSDNDLWEQAWEVTPSGPPTLSQYRSQRRKVNTSEFLETESEFSSDDDEDAAYTEVFIGQIDF